MLGLVGEGESSVWRSDRDIKAQVLTDKRTEEESEPGVTSPRSRLRSLEGSWISQLESDLGSGLLRG